MNNNFNFPPKPNVIARAFVITILVTFLAMTFHFVARAMIYELIHDVWFRAYVHFAIGVVLAYCIDPL